MAVNDVVSITQSVYPWSLIGWVCRVFQIPFEGELAQSSFNEQQTQKQADEVPEFEGQPVTPEESLDMWPEPCTVQLNEYEHVLSPSSEQQARKLADEALELGRQSITLEQAAERMEEAFELWPKLREEYEEKVALWRRGIGAVLLPSKEQQARKLADEALELGRQSITLEQAAERLEEAFELWPKLRDEYEHKMALWRRGIVS